MGRERRPEHYIAAPLKRNGVAIEILAPSAVTGPREKRRSRNGVAKASLAN
jgi:hypothetical protein